MPVMPGAETGPSSPKISRFTWDATVVGFESRRSVVRPTVVAPPTSQIDPFGSVHDAAASPRKSGASTS